MKRILCAFLFGILPFPSLAATGDSLLLFTPLSVSLPNATPAALAAMTGAATPAELVPILQFDDTTQEYADFVAAMPEHYAGTTGVTLTVIFSAAETSTDVCNWEAAFRAVPDDAEDIDTTAHSYAYNQVEGTAPSVVGEVAYDNITFTDGADMDSVAAGTYFILRVTRDPTPESGTDVTGDCSIHALLLKET